MFVFTHGRLCYYIGVKLPATKKQRASPDETCRSLLVDGCAPEIMRRVYSFLNLQEALQVCCTCRQFNNSTDAFLYCYISCIHRQDVHVKEPERLLGVKQNKILYNLQRTDKLRALIQNKSLHQSFFDIFISQIVYLSEADNAEALSVVLNDQRFQNEIINLDTAIKRNFTSMAQVLQEDERIKGDIQMCATCSVNIGAFSCQRWQGCRNFRGEGEQWKKYCRACVLPDNRFCKECDEYLCPDCFESANYHVCEKCRRLNCCSDYSECNLKFRICTYRYCGKEKCSSCIKSDNELWTVDHEGDPWCQACYQYLLR